MRLHPFAGFTQGILMYTINCNPTDPLIGLPASLPSVISAINRTPNSPTSHLAGFSTTGVPGFAPPDAGTFATYRRISAHPTVALVMQMVISPVVANTWGWSKKPDVPQAQLDFVKEMLSPMRSQIVSDSLRALAMGFAGFEKVWTLEDGRMVLSKLKPLLPEITQVLVDSKGNFRGLRNLPPSGPSRDILGNKAFLYTYDGEYGNYYGRSRHENVRVAWSQAMQTAERMAQYQKKIAGVIAQLHYPEGTSRDAAGVERSNDWIAQQILEAVSMGRSVRFPNLFASIEDPATAADLAGKSQWVLSQFDLGGTDYSPGLLNSLAYYDKLLFRGWLRPERVGLDTEHGSRADSETHSQSSIVDSELIDQDFAAAFSRGVIDDILTLNFGPAARGSVWVEPSPISDSQTNTITTVLSALLANNQTAASVAGQIDVAAVLEDLNVPVKAAGPNLE
jgi:hypothetical protein